LAPIRKGNHLIAVLTTGSLPSQRTVSQGYPLSAIGQPGPAIFPTGTKLGSEESRDRCCLAATRRDTITAGGWQSGVQRRYKV